MQPLFNAPAHDLRELGYDRSLSDISSEVTDAASRLAEAATLPAIAALSAAEWRMAGLGAADRQAIKTVLDAYALWTFSPDLKLRLTMSNLLAADTESITRVENAGLLDNSRSRSRSWLTTQLRLEMKL